MVQPSNGKSSRQTKTVGPSILLVSLLENHWRKIGWSCSSPIRAFKFLMSKFLFATEENFTESDRVALFYTYELMVKLCARDPLAFEKHFWYLWVTRVVIQSLREPLDRAIRIKLQMDLMPLFSHGRGYFSAHGYFGRKIEGERLYELWIQTRFPTKSKAKRHVGVGYNDSGTARDVARDGSPHWTEVAEANRDQPESSTSDKEERLWLNLLVHEAQILRASSTSLSRASEAHA